MKQKVYAAVMALVLVGCFGFLGCSSSGTSSDVPAEEQKNEAEQATKQEAASQDAKYAVSIDEGTVGADYKGNPTLVVTYTFTNNSDKATSFMVAVSAKAFQNGVELSSAITDEVDAQVSMQDVKPGVTLTVQKAYELADQSEVSVECSELISFNDSLIAEKTFTVA